MNIDSRAVVPLKVFLLGLFALLLVFQFLSFPGKFAYMAQETPGEAYLRWPLTALAAFLIFCVEVVVVATWRLLGLVQSDRIFSNASFAWVDAIVWAIAAAWLVMVGILAWVLSFADDPGLPMVLLFVDTGIAVAGLLMVVMRALLRQATALRTDLDGVI